MALLYINNNGTILSHNAPTIHPGNRGHLYGDGVFESVRIMSGKTLNLENHILRMMAGAKAIKLRTPAYYTTAFFEEKITELLQKSEI